MTSESLSLSSVFSRLTSQLQANAVHGESLARRSEFSDVAICCAALGRTLPAGCGSGHTAEIQLELITEDVSPHGFSMHAKEDVNVSTSAENPRRHDRRG